jgi:predicted transcriptional regulator
MLKPMETADVSRTRMMQNGSTSYKNFKNYLNLMTKHELIREKNDYEKHLVLSQQGMRYIEIYEQLMGLFKGSIRE